MPTTVTRTVGDVVTVIEIPDSVDPMKALEIIEQRFLSAAETDQGRDERWGLIGLLKKDQEIRRLQAAKPKREKTRGTTIPGGWTADDVAEAMRNQE